MASPAAPDVVETGTVVGAGSLICLECGIAVALAALDEVPSCPACGHAEFRRASLFEQPTVSEPAVAEDEADLGWLTELRDELAIGRYCLHVIAPAPDRRLNPAALDA